MGFLTGELVPVTLVTFNLKFPNKLSVKREFGDAMYSDSKQFSSFSIV